MEEAGTSGNNEDTGSSGVREEDDGTSDSLTYTASTQDGNDFQMSNEVAPTRINIILNNLTIAAKVIVLLTALYIFICSLNLLSTSISLLAGNVGWKTISQSDLLNNPLGGMLSGMILTVLFQSSTITIDSIVVMAADEIFDVQSAIPMVMGANIGTTIANSLVAVVQVKHRCQFQQAFTAATVHDVFNLLTVLVLLPLEAATHYLYHLTTAIVLNMEVRSQALKKQDFLRAFTKLFTRLIVQTDNKIIEELILRKPGADKKSIVKHCCKWSGSNVTSAYRTEECLENCYFMLELLSRTWSDSSLGSLLLLMSILSICCCIFLIVDILLSLIQGNIASVVKRFINAELPGRFAFLTNYIAILVGTGFTCIVQSNIVFTCILTPLAGIGLLSADRMFPLTVGSNIGTSTTGILSAFAQKQPRRVFALEVAFSHLLFNISGVIIWFPIPFVRRTVMKISNFLGDTVFRYRWFAILYITFTFFLLPVTISWLSLLGWKVCVGVFTPVTFLLLTVVIINVLQNTRPSVLPERLQTWEFLPVFMRSLEPYDNVIVSLINYCSLSEVEAESPDSMSSADLEEILANMPP